MSYTIQSYPLLDAFAGSGGALHGETLEWMKKWKGMDLDDSAKFQFTEVTGSTSINLRIQTVGADPKSRGSFVPRNGAANPNTEIAYLNIAAIVGWDNIYRPAARYELGPIASARLQPTDQFNADQGDPAPWEQEKNPCRYRHGRPS